MNRAIWALTALLLLPALPALAQNENIETGEKTELAPPKPGKLFTLELKDAPVRQALENLFNNAGVQYTIEDEITGFVTLNVVDKPLETILKLLLRTAQPTLSYIKENGIYRITSRTDLGTQDPMGPGIPMITIDLRDAPLRSALEQVFKTARQQYVIAPEVDGKVTMKISNQPLPQALTVMLRASDRPLTWRLKQGVYYVEPTERQYRPPSQDTRATTGPPAGSQGVLILIHNVPAADLLRLLAPMRPAGIDHLTVQPGTNALMAYSSDPEALGLLRQRITLLDVVADTVTLKAEIVRIDEKNVRTVLFSTTLQGRSGTESRVGDKTNGAPTAATDIRITLTPTVLSGRTEVTSSWELSFPLTGTKGGSVRLEKSISTKTQLQPGKLTLVGETRRNQNGIKDQIQFYLSAEPEVQTDPRENGVTRVTL